MTDPLEDVLTWVKSHPGTGLRDTDVPGASASELAALATLGRLCGQARTHLHPHLKTADALHHYFHGNQRVTDWFTGSTSPKAPDDVRDALIRLLAADGEDGLAHLYSKLVAPARRRTLGTFFTRALEVDRMISGWSEQASAPATVIDVGAGAGVGIYTMSAAQEWPEATVHAIDINPVTLGLLALRLANDTQPVDASGTNATVHLVLDDYIGWATANWASLPSPRLVLGNPPYTRMQLLPKAMREDLYEQAEGLLGRRASLAVLITAITVTLLEDDDGLCLLLPAQWLESDYAVGLRAWLWNATRRRIDLRLFSSSLFDDAQVDAVSLLIGPDNGTAQPLHVATNDDEFASTDRTAANPVEWRSLFGAASRAAQTRTAQAAAPRVRAVTTSATANQAPTTLTDVAVVHRGVATGANWFFVLSEADRDELAIPLDYVRPLMRRLRDANSETRPKRTSECVTDFASDAYRPRQRGRDRRSPQTEGPRRLAAG